MVVVTSNDEPAIRQIDEDALGAEAEADRRGNSEMRVGS